MLIDVHGHIGRIVPDRREFIDATNLIAKWTPGALTSPAFWP